MADGNVHAFAEAKEANSLNDFLHGLTALSRQTGIAVNGNPELVLMDAPEDYALSYKADAESRLSLD